MLKKVRIVVKIHTRFCIPTKQPVASNQRNSFYICFLFTVPLLFLSFAVKCSTISFLVFPSVTRRIYFRLRVICPVKFPAFCLVNATTNTKPNETRYHCWERNCPRQSNFIRLLSHSELLLRFAGDIAIIIITRNVACIIIPNVIHIVTVNVIPTVIFIIIAIIHRCNYCLISQKCILCYSVTISIFIAIAVPIVIYTLVIAITIIMSSLLLLLLPLLLPFSSSKLHLPKKNFNNFSEYSKVENIEHIHISIRSEIVTSTIRISCLHSYRALFVASVISCSQFLVSVDFVPIGQSRPSQSVSMAPLFSLVSVYLSRLPSNDACAT